VFERFTERARQVVVLAQHEARDLKHNYIGTEHLLLGLLAEQEGLAARVLASLGVTPEDARERVEKVVGPGDEVSTGQIPFTPHAKKALELSLREALSLEHNYIETEHILLGLIRENNGAAARILLDFDLDADRIRDAVFEGLEPHTVAANVGRLRRGWEYHVEYCDEVIGERLNQLGREGWELVGIDHAERYQLVFKRKR
jgi:ATP-dependent Clp protease ATP-binding subunit ClpC